MRRGPLVPILAVVIAAGAAFVWLKQLGYEDKRRRDEQTLAERWPKVGELKGCEAGIDSATVAVVVGDTTAEIPCSARGRSATLNADGTYAQVALWFTYDTSNELRDRGHEPQPHGTYTTSLDVR